jgi:hypothetical protein
MPSFRISVAVAIISVPVLLWANWPSAAESSRPFETAKVRLYSDGQVVGEWEAQGEGRVEGDTLVFSVRKGTQDLEVRIRGTFSYEVQP